jgi:hypothetical protein
VEFAKDPRGNGVFEAGLDGIENGLGDGPRRLALALGRLGTPLVVPLLFAGMDDGGIGKGEKEGKGKGKGEDPGGLGESMVLMRGPGFRDVRRVSHLRMVTHLACILLPVAAVSARVARVSCCLVVALWPGCPDFSVYSAHYSCDNACKNHRCRHSVSSIQGSLSESCVT